ncbi:MAG: glycoside hydrolase family 88 protein [Bacteroidales bacterium]|nr:glycoside hydrolase family 88 protein [Bacteroidales bacterium]
MRHIAIAALAAILVVAGCRENIDNLSERVFEVAREQVAFQASLVPEGRCATTINKEGKLLTSDNYWWCSGFFSGTCWLVYEATGDEAVRELARERTDCLEPLKTRTVDHDLGFQTNCSFGNALRLCPETEDHDRDVIITAANSLAKRFNPVVGCTRRWNGGNFKVIIDNMMNLELLLKGYELSGTDSLRTIAVSHADRTIENHFRENYSSYHVLDYNPEDGSVISRKTAQGYSDGSSWARGQAWGLYGYTMMYRFTGDEDYLNQACRIADYIISRLPEDYVPYWDYDDPILLAGKASGDPSSADFVPRDASAGAIAASALAELGGFVSDRAKSREYRKVAEMTVRQLASPEYLAEPGTNGGFILKHSTGSKPVGSEVDVPLSYADYYFLEALLRL